jgi:hypothetical protein
MPSSIPPRESVHPDVLADAGADDLLELDDEEILLQLQAAGLEVTGAAEGGGEDLPEPSLEESGAWSAYSEPPPPPGKQAPGAPAGGDDDDRSAE